MDSSLVIKVKYEETLRRFSACVNENNQLDLDLAGLRAKICSLFNFTADANLVLRYIDEDGDLVTLVDDDDLRDVMRQRLPFLRIDIHMSNGSGDKPNSSSRGNATPLRSHVTDPFRSGNVVVADVWKSVQEPLTGALSNLCLDSKAVSSANPVLANLADTISKVGKPILNSHFQPSVATGPSTKNGTPGEHAIPKAKGQQSTYVNANFTDFISRSANPPFNSLYQPHVVSGTSLKNGVLGEHVTPEARGLPQPGIAESTSGSPFHAFADFVSKFGKPVGNSHYQWPHHVAGVRGEHVTPEERGRQSTYVDKSSNGIQPMETGNVIRDSMERGAPVDLNIPPFDLYSSQSTNVNITPLSPAVPDGDSKNGTNEGKNSGTHKGKNSWISSSSAAPSNGSNWTSSNDYIKTPTYLRDSATLLTKSSGTSSSTAPANSSTMTSSTAFVKPPIYTGDLGVPSSRTLYINMTDHAMAPISMIHRGVQCGGCGVCPIVGYRFNSKVKDNYGLCSTCFNKVGNVGDYNRIDHLRSRYLSALARNSKLARSKLDSRFILDVNVIDGTMMAPSTAFTKIWRIRNNGTLVWPLGTQLVWIGGDNFSDSHLVDLQVPKEGLHVDKELDIAVDFIAPQLPGRYISYWRVASPSGQKFGQRVWVLIQVDASLKESFYDRSQGLNLSIPLDVSGSKASQLIDINVQPTDDHIPNAHTELVNEMVDNQLMMQELLNNLNDGTDIAAAPVPTIAATAASAPATSAAASSAPATSAAASSAPATSAAAASAPATSAAASSAPATSAAASSAPATSAAAASAPATSAAAASAPATSAAAASAPATSAAAASAPATSAAAASAPATSAAAASAPATSASAASAPATSTSAASAPATSTSAASAPATSTSAASAPATSTSAASAPATSTSAASAPATSTSAASAPATSTSAASAPATSTAAASAPATSTAAASVPTIALSSVSYPNIYLSETGHAVPSSQQSAAVDVPSSTLGVGVNNSVEETLLKELEEMGFKQVDLNLGILRMNEYNLEQSVDDLCGFYEWDPILEELHEMF
ncbi:PREDICTED: protein NBR1 homolog isoform X2 [Lupinus angustifolius]|uniref:protein NBR1 homolog isoform X2 n=1 Tax=Lupinus angustifolius TaxID=3871 RepID=UPI00092F762E|nr:PREDICTED: protein NBR1 homolog isoform X2 [Lupinus angustifolius]